MNFILKNLNFGATIGRYAGRIENASFKLDDDTFQIESNDGQHHLHGAVMD